MTSALKSPEPPTRFRSSRAGLMLIAPVTLTTIATLATLVGCNSAGQAGVDTHVWRNGGNNASDQPWWPVPVAASVYPSTRFVLESGEPYLEAAIELKDELDESVSAPGSVTIGLLQAMPGGDDQVLFSWDLDMNNIEAQRTHRSGVLGHYVFRLKLNDLEPREVRTRLSVTWQLPDGTTLKDTQTVRTDW